MRAGLLGGMGALAAPMINRGRCLIAADAIEVSTRAVDLVLGSTTVDMLGLLTLDWPRLFRWQRDPGDFEESDFRKLESTGINIFHPAIETAAAEPHDAARVWIDGWRRLLWSQPCFLQQIDSITALLQAPRLGKTGVIVGFQNSNHFRDTADVAAFYALGQRVSQLTYNSTNRLGSGCLAPRDRGLTSFGAEVLAAMNEVGMAIDVSHCGDRTTLDALAASSKPVLVTHSNCRALNPGQPRCKSDDVIRLLAAGGGVMGITMVRAFVGRPASLERLLDHFDHVARLAGAEHVGIGSDIDVEGVVPATGRPDPLYALAGVRPDLRTFQIADGLLRRGYQDRDVELMLGGNFVRALTQIWPEESWAPVPERETRRDPFCPAPRRLPPPTLASPQ